MPIVLSSLAVYPVKSLRGLTPAQWSVASRGLAYDRHWMVVDSNGLFLTQRQHPRMALVDTHLTADRLILSAQSMPELELPRQSTGSRIEVRVWGEPVLAESAGDMAAAWLSDYLQTSARLVCFPTGKLRQVDLAYAQPGDSTAFADGFPFLLLGEASLAELNSRLQQPLEMRRFRPNLVVAGSAPFAEDRWRRIQIGDLSFRVVKPCSRCVITSIDPDSGEKGSEPLRTLATYRRRGGKVMFGQNLIHDTIGHLRVGDPVTVLEADDD
jgi:uncharacterized protein YcbX